MYSHYPIVYTTNWDNNYNALQINYLPPEPKKEGKDNGDDFKLGINNRLHTVFNNLSHLSSFDDDDDDDDDCYYGCDFYDNYLL